MSIYIVAYTMYTCAWQILIPDTVVNLTSASIRCLTAKVKAAVQIIILSNDDAI